MVSWLCPYCNKRMYSADGLSHKQLITCLSCQLKFINPYYGPQPSEKRKQQST